MKRVLVTGAGGFIGRHCLAGLKAHGYEVHATSTRAPGTGGPADAWHQADLLAEGQPAALVDAVRPTHLLHLAWVTTPGRYWTAPENLDWVRASLALARAFEAQGGQRLVVAGTCAEYAWGAPRLGESSPTVPGTLYGTSKHALQQVLSAWGASGGPSVAWGRVFHLYGPHEAPGRFVPAVVRAFLAGEPARLTHGEQVRDLMHVQDVADAFVALLESAVTGPVNVASGIPVRLRDVAEAIARAFDRPDWLRFGAVPAPAGEPHELVAETGRLLREVGWTPTMTLEDGLADTIAWWRTHLQETRTP